MKTAIFHDGFEGFVQRSGARSSKRMHGERIEEETIITFADAEDLLECLSPARVRLFQFAKTRDLSVSDLARELGRNRSAVTRDVNKLRKYGLVELRECINPGHGRVKLVHPVARKVSMQVAL